MSSIPHDWLGRQPYAGMWQGMQQRAEGIADDAACEVIWLCEHEPVYTTGRRGIDNRLGGELPAPMFKTDRGGETTFHGPGQIMLYPIINLRARGLGVRDYVHLLEQSCIDVLASLGAPSQRRCGFPGVWTSRGKIAALGVRVSRGVAYHGMALNVAVDPCWFAAINPCGLGLSVANISDFVSPPSLDGLAGRWADKLAVLL